MGYLKDKKEITNWLSQFGVLEEDFIINEDFSVDVSADVNLGSKNLNSIAVRFGVVKGNFYIDRNNLTTLENCPTQCEYFNCSYNHLSSLKGCPQIVQNNFSCQNNVLTSLEHFPQNNNLNINCSKNLLKSLKGLPPIVNSLEVNENQLESLEHCPAIHGYRASFYSNKIKSLKGLPSHIPGDLDVSYNLLTTLEFCPSVIKCQFSACDNQLTSLEFFPVSVKQETFLSGNAALGDIVKEQDFEVLYDIHKAHKEKRLLQNNIVSTTSESIEVFKI